MAIDLAGYSTAVPGVTAYFIGRRADGSSVSTNLPANAINFQTYYFGPRWSGLSRVDVPGFDLLDNVFLSILEPSAGALICAGALLLSFSRTNAEKRLPQLPVLFLGAWLVSGGLYRINELARRKVKFSFFLITLAFPIVCDAQGRLTIGFDGPPMIPQGMARVVQDYYESLPGSDGFTRTAPGPWPSYPDDRTAYLQASLGDSLIFSNANGNTFSLQAVDLAGYSTVVPDFSVSFIGYHQNGITVTNIFSGSGITFRTVYFGSDFSGLTRVEIPTYAWSMDNLTISIPGPNTGALMCVGILALWFSRFTNRSCPPGSSGHRRTRII